MNAVKFKLTKLRTTLIRYEVIYKNLVRDLRKFYSRDFNDVTEYIKKKKQVPQKYNHFLEIYIRTKFSRELEQLGIPMKDMIFNLGSLVYPKEMIKLLKDDETS
jgi:hypothetical protein